MQSMLKYCLLILCLSIFQSQNTAEAQVLSLQSKMNCRTCKFIIEKKLNGLQVTESHWCDELQENFPESYNTCLNVLESHHQHQIQIQTWIDDGCFEDEEQTIWHSPCPAGFICSQLASAKGYFCE